MHAVIATPAGRQVRLLRLLAVIAILAGLALTHGVQCRDGMTAMIHGVAAGATRVVAHPSGDAMVIGFMDADAPGEAPAGLLGACLSLLVGVLAAMLLVRRFGRVVVAGAAAATRPKRWAPSRPRAPSLAQLCLLRT